MGFRHGHINAVLGQLKRREDATLAAACEEHDATRESVNAKGTAEVAFSDYAEMLDSVECDAVAVGDYYAKRGAVIIEALRRGKHVISDKPICTSLADLDRIARLARANGLSVGCQLDLRSHGSFRALRELVHGGELGEIHAVSFEGQHPLMYGSRAEWYFEEGKHGGTLNDLAIHGIDFVSWMTGTQYTCVNAARNWNATIREVPFFKDAAQVMLTMENGCGVLGDVSYLTPDSFGYGLPHYWRTTVWGSRGVAETSCSAKHVTLWQDGDKEPRAVPPAEPAPGAYMDAFLNEIRGRTEGLELTTAEVLRSAHVTLAAQHAADEGLTNFGLPPISATA